MAGRYFVNLLFTVIVLVIICLLNLNGVSSIFNFLVEVDAAIIVIVFPLIFMGILHGWKNIRPAFSVLFDKNIDKMALLNAKTFFENYGKAVFSISFIAFLIPFIAITRNSLFYGDYASILSNTGIYSILLLYAGIINIVIVIPYKIIINKKITEIKN